MYELEIQVAARAVRLAAALCQTVQRQLAVSETAAKADKSPVTVADYGSQALVSWALEKALGPGISLVAEEDSDDLRDDNGRSMLLRITDLVNGTISHVDAEASSPSLTEAEVVAAIDRGRSPGGPNGRHWVLDPIDGTKGFVRGEQYAVALGLLEEGKVVLGVLGCPNLPLSPPSKGSEGTTGCLFLARIGQGTTVEPLDGSSPPHQIRVSGVSDPAWAVFCESYESAHSKQDLTANIARVLGVTAPPVRMDSQAKYGAMARGDAAIYLRFPHTGYREKIWDHAAGAIIVTEAGGVVCDAAGHPLDFSRGRFLDLEKGILASNAALMPVLLAAVQTCLKGEQPGGVGVGAT